MVLGTTSELCMGVEIKMAFSVNVNEFAPNGGSHTPR